MALGGGTYSYTGDKSLPGSYINFSSKRIATVAISSRGVAAVPVVLDWGTDGAVISVTKGQAQKYCLKMFGYSYTAPEMKWMRDMFCNASKLLVYKINDGVKADSTLATAKYKGECGNNISILVSTNADDTSKFDVETYYGTKMVDTQTITSADELEDNDYVTFKTTATLTASATAIALSNGSTSELTGEEYSTFLEKIEPYNYSALACTSTTPSVIALFKAFEQRMRTEVGKKFQLVVYDTKADDYGIISVKNSVDLVYWVTGAAASVSLSKSLTNTTYDGEYEISTDYTQAQLLDYLADGQFVFHKVDDEYRVLDDINTLTSTSEDVSDDFKQNQTIRIIDQIAIDVAAAFNDKFLGKYRNTADGRAGLWNTIDNYLKEMEKAGAIESYDPDTLTVSAGDSKKDVVVEFVVNVVNCMSALYMNVVVA